MKQSDFTMTLITTCTMNGGSVDVKTTVNVETPKHDKHHTTIRTNIINHANTRIPTPQADDPRLGYIVEHHREALRVFAARRYQERVFDRALKKPQLFIEPRRVYIASIKPYWTRQQKEWIFFNVYLKADL